MSELICKGCDQPITGQYSGFALASSWESEDCQPIYWYYHNECSPKLEVPETKKITPEILYGWSHSGTMMPGNIPQTRCFNTGELADKINEFFGVKESK